MTTTAADTTNTTMTPTTISQLCTYLAPNQMANLYAALALNAQDSDAEERKPYHQMMDQIHDQLVNNCGEREAARYLVYAGNPGR